MAGVPQSGDTRAGRQRRAAIGLAIGALLLVPTAASAVELDPWYGRIALEDGITYTAPAGVSDAAIDEAVMVVRHETTRPDIRARLARAHARFTVMADSNTLTDVPEYRVRLPIAWGMTPAEIDGRARGLGGYDWLRPTVAAADNLTCASGDRWTGYSVATHEFAHQVMAAGLARAEQASIRRAYRAAHVAGTWRRYYADRSEKEYFAEGAVWWFEASTWVGPDGVVMTRAALQQRDPALSRILKAAFGDDGWRFPRRTDRALSCTPEAGTRAFPTISRISRRVPSHGTNHR